MNIASNKFKLHFGWKTNGSVQHGNNGPTINVDA